MSDMYQRSAHSLLKTSRSPPSCILVGDVCKYVTPGFSGVLHLDLLFLDGKLLLQSTWRTPESVSPWCSAPSRRPLELSRVPIDLLRLQVGVDLLGWGSADSGAVVSPSAQPHLRVFGVRRRRRCEAKLQQPQTSKGLIDFQTCHGWLYNSYPHF